MKEEKGLQNDIGKHCNIPNRGGCYYCRDNRKLEHIDTERRNNNRYTQTYEVYVSSDYSGCEHKSK